MKEFKGFAEAKAAAQNTGVERLPVGGYVCKVMDVEYVEGQGDNSDFIKIAFDIIEGPYAEYFKNKYEKNTNEDKKWPGKASVWVPKDDGTEKDTWTRNRFAAWTNSFEESNPGYTWDWDENKWKDKVVGIVFGETGTVIDGKEILYTEPRHAESVETIRSGKYWKEKFKAKNGYTGTQKDTTSDNSEYGWTDIPVGTNAKIPF